MLRSSTFAARWQKRGSMSSVYWIELRESRLTQTSLVEPELWRLSFRYWNTRESNIRTTTNAGMLFFYTIMYVFRNPSLRSTFMISFIIYYGTNRYFHPKVNVREQMKSLDGTRARPVFLILVSSWMYSACISHYSAYPKCTFTDFRNGSNVTYNENQLQWNFFSMHSS
jgi:hypothetical protein